VPLSSYEAKVLGVLAEKSPADSADCARLAEIGTGVTEAVLHSLVNKGLAEANRSRKGLSRKPDGTYSITAEGQAALGEV
jgi:DNA-binding PadR family transcriptional regulator